MPQLLSSATSLDEFESDAAILEKYPELAAKISHIVASWSMVETYNALMFVMLIRSGSDTAMSMYEGLTGDGAKDAAITSVARDTLDPDTFKIFLAVRSLVKRVGKQRNEIVHGVIGHAPALGKGLVILNQRAMLKQMYVLFIKQHDGSDDPLAARQRASDLFRKSAYLYTAEDFDEIIQRCSWAEELMMYLAVLCAEDHHLKSQARTRLSNDPLLQRELERLNRGVNNSL